MNIRRSVVAIAFLLAMGLTSASAAEYLTVSDANGNKTSFALSEKPTVTFSSENIILTAGDQTVEYPLTEYRSFTFTNDNETTAIGQVETAAGSNAVFSFANGIHGEGLEAGSRVVVYNLGGQTVGSAKVSADGSLDIQLDAAGVYVVKTSAKSFKFIKK